MPSSRRHATPKRRAATSPARRASRASSTPQHLKQTAAATARPGCAAASATLCDTVLRRTGQLALVLLATIFFRAAFVSGDLWSDSDWTISNVMIYPCNEHLTYFGLAPAYLIMCTVYSLKLSSLRIRLGSVTAVVGGLGLIAYPTTTHMPEHLAFAFVIFLSSLFWHPECSAAQFHTFGISSVLFLAGGAVEAVLKHLKHLGGAISFWPSFCCMVGEFGIFITWGCMLLNPRMATRTGTAGQLRAGPNRCKQRANAE
jgi:hypothetical protein